MLDWIFEGIIDWVAGIASSIMDAISGLFLNALGTDMTAMEEYFPFVSAAFDVMQYMAWALLFLICVWQLFRVFGGPITDAENPWQLVVRSCLFGVLVGYAKPIFTLVLDIARAPYTALLDVEITGEDFTFAGLEEVISNGLVTIASTITVIAPLLLLILLISVGWNYFKLLLETVERYIVVGVLCYTSPCAYIKARCPCSTGCIRRHTGITWIRSMVTAFRATAPTANATTASPRPPPCSCAPAWR